VLNLGTFDGDATVHLGRRDTGVAPWPFIAPGQRVWLRAFGKRADGAEWSKTLLSAHTFTSTEAVSGCSVSLDRATLEDTQDGSEIRIEAKLSFVGNPDEAKAMVFLSVVYRLSHLSSVTVTFDGMPNGFLEVGRTLTTPDGRMEFVLLHGGAKVEDFGGGAPYFMEQYLRLDNAAPSTVSLVPSESFREVRMAVAPHPLTTLTVTFFDKLDMFIDSATKMYDGNTASWFQYRSNEKRIYRMEVTVAGTRAMSLIDNITLSS
jgi:hypothetical protein